MTDIHCHLLPMVDDGGDDILKSLEILRAMVLNGTDKVILTPHGADGARINTPEFLTEKFNAFVKTVREAGINVKLYLGEEVAFTRDFYNRKKSDFLTLAGSKALLIEFLFCESEDISDEVYNLSALGYTPVVAHVERYENAFNEKCLAEIKAAGGVTQVNADTLLKERGESAYKKCVKFIKNGLIDVVASDTHQFRVPSLKAAEAVVRKKCGEEAAEALFFKNAEKIIFNE